MLVRDLDCECWKVVHEKKQRKEFSIQFERRKEDS